MSKFMKLVVVALLAFGFSATAQEKFPASSKGTLPAPILVPSIADQIKNGTVKYADNTPQLGHPKGRPGNNVVPGKGATGPDPLVELQRNAVQTPMRSPSLVFTADISQAIPSDPTGAAGVNQYMAAWNSAFRIFDKNGNPETAELALGTIFPGNNIGDPIIFFDAEAENGDGEPRGRFVITEFDNNPNGFNVAVSTGPDAMESAWHVYTTGFGTGAFPDYTKFAVWGDSYIVTANINNGANGDRVFAVERNEMLQGNPAQFVGFPLPGIATNGFYSPHGFHITDDQHPAPGTPAPIIYMQDDSWAGVSEDHLQIWEATIDWANPANHSIVSAQEIGPSDGLVPFQGVFDGGSFSNRPQPGGPDIDVLQATVMNQVQYRRFGTHNSVVLNFVINTEADNGGELAGIRWYELRQPTGDDNEDWVIYQQGTYNAPDGRDAYSGSMVMNTEGDIALAYTSSSATDMISIRYTGRQGDDATLNVMTSAEQLIAQSTAPNPNLRLADYVHLTIDPVDDSFWHIAEYFEPTRRDVVANFELLEPMPDDIGVSSIDSPMDGVLTNAEDIVISIRNFGNNDISDPMVQYSVDGVDAPAETLTGTTIAAGETISHTFATPADLSIDGQTYTIVATTLLSGDSNTDNDASTKMVTNAVQLCEPVSDCAGFDDGVTQLQLADQDIVTNCGATGYSDDRDIIFTFDPDGPGGLDGVLQMGFADSIFAIWIDVNDNAVFEPGEVVATEQVANANTDFAFTLDLSAFTVEELLGEHIMRVRGEDESTAGDVLDPCGDLAFGRTNDYTAFFDPALNVEEEAFEDSDFVISTNDNQHFEISLNTGFEGKASINVFNLLGQQLVYNNLSKEGNQFNYDLDMSYAAKGVYIVQFNTLDGGSSISQKIIVK